MLIVNGVVFGMLFMVIHGLYIIKSILYNNLYNNLKRSFISYIDLFTISLYEIILYANHSVSFPSYLGSLYFVLLPSFFGWSFHPQHELAVITHDYCLVPDFWGEIFVFSPWSFLNTEFVDALNSAEDSSERVLGQVENLGFCLLITKCFYYEGVLIVFTFSFCIYWDDP